MAARTPPPPRRPRSLDEPYLPGDTIPAPVAEETHSETTWNLFNNLSAKQDRVFAETQPASALSPPTTQSPPQGQQPKGDRRYAKTEPAPLRIEPKPKAPTKSVAAATLTLDDVMVEARRSNRICPTEDSWLALYALLPGKVQGEKGMQPTPPLKGAALKQTSSLARRMFLRDHIEWADTHGGLQAVYEFLKALPEEQWHHMGE
ncbi:MAG: hypothetical protein ACAH21_00705 [Ramlibacter sp.]|nr:hypothetical protein [Ramlibacter sp.]